MASDLVPLLTVSILWALCCSPSHTVQGTLTDSKAGGARQGDGERISTVPALRKLLQVELVSNGEPAPKERFPYACSLRAFGIREHICGGTLIDPEWVLTAAHCFDDPNPLGQTLLVYVGAHELDDDDFDEIIVSESVIIHEFWDGNAINGFDIALVKLERPTKNVPARMARSQKRLVNGQPLVIAGWGDTTIFGDRPNILQFADTLAHIRNTFCEDSWPGLKDSMVCAVSENQGGCKGDSGGPLLIGDARRGRGILGGRPGFDLLVGIVSFGENKCLPGDQGKPDVFTRVSSFRAWIDGKMSGSSTGGSTPVRSSPGPTPTPTPISSGITCRSITGTDYPGNDIIQTPILNIVSSNDCCALCRSRRGCNGWLWRKDFNHCWLKSILVNPEPCSNCVVMAL